MYVCVYIYIYIFFRGCDPTRVMASPFVRSLDHTQRRTTVGRTSLDECSARCTDLYLTTHNTHNRQTFMPPTGFKPSISGGKRPQTYALDRAATGTGTSSLSGHNIILKTLFSNTLSLRSSLNVRDCLM